MIISLHIASCHKMISDRCADLSRVVVLKRFGGRDASKQFWKYHNEGILKKYKGQLQVGSLETSSADAEAKSKQDNDPAAPKARL